MAGMAGAPLAATAPGGPLSGLAALNPMSSWKDSFTPCTGAGADWPLGGPPGRR